MLSSRSVSENKDIKEPIQTRERKGVAFCFDHNPHFPSLGLISAATLPLRWLILQGAFNLFTPSILNLWDGKTLQAVLCYVKSRG